MAETYSHSRLSNFENCPLKFQYRYILKIPSETESIEAFVGSAEFGFTGEEKHQVVLTSPSLVLAEAIATDGSRITGRCSYDLRLLARHGITLLGVSRQGKRFRDRVRKLKIGRASCRERV